jgi:hypothetical protein
LSGFKFEKKKKKTGKYFKNGPSRKNKPTNLAVDSLLLKKFFINDFFYFKTTTLDTGVLFNLLYFLKFNSRKKKLLSKNKPYLFFYNNENYRLSVFSLKFLHIKFKGAYKFFKVFKKINFKKNRKHSKSKFRILNLSSKTNFFSFKFSNKKAVLFHRNKSSLSFDLRRFLNLKKKIPIYGGIKTKKLKNTATNASFKKYTLRSFKLSSLNKSKLKINALNAFKNTALKIVKKRTALRVLVKRSNFTRLLVMRTNRPQFNFKRVAQSVMSRNCLLNLSFILKKIRRKTFKFKKLSLLKLLRTFFVRRNSHYLNFFYFYCANNVILNKTFFRRQTRRPTCTIFSFFSNSLRAVILKNKINLPVLRSKFAPI